MPNRKTFDANDRYDHSSHSTREKEPGDLQTTPHHAHTPVDAPQVPLTDASQSPRSTSSRKKKPRK